MMLLLEANIFWYTCALVTRTIIISMTALIVTNIDAVIKSIT